MCVCIYIYVYIYTCILHVKNTYFRINIHIYIEREISTTHTDMATNKKQKYVSNRNF